MVAHFSGKAAELQEFLLKTGEPADFTPRCAGTRAQYFYELRGYDETIASEDQLGLTTTTRFLVTRDESSLTFDIIIRTREDELNSGSGLRSSGTAFALRFDGSVTDFRDDLSMGPHGKPGSGDVWVEAAPGFRMADVPEFLPKSVLQQEAEEKVGELLGVLFRCGTFISKNRVLGR